MAAVVLVSRSPQPSRGASFPSRDALAPRRWPSASCFALVRGALTGLSGVFVSSDPSDSHSLFGEICWWAVGHHWPCPLLLFPQAHVDRRQALCCCCVAVGSWGWELPTTCLHGGCWWGEIRPHHGTRREGKEWCVKAGRADAKGMDMGPPGPEHRDCAGSERRACAVTQEPRGSSGGNRGRPSLNTTGRSENTCPLLTF